MVDRDARDKLVGIIQNYLEERITAFTFDEGIHELAFRTEDETVKHVVRMLWFHYDDCKDHRVVLCKEQWDYFQRLLLLLRSDASVHVERLRIWSWHQAAAALLLSCFVAVAIVFGWGVHLFLVSLPLGVASIMLSRSKRAMFRDEWEERTRLTPFTSLAQVSDVRRGVFGFKKRPYPATLAKRAIRSPGMSMALNLQFWAVWSLFSPVALCIQVFPMKYERVKVKA
ncbi:MAG: hypothetical protein AMXMBFR13_26870 [Phycisphaerae bacterium]